MKAEDVGNGRGGIQVISRAASVLRSLKEHPEGLSLGQIAADVDLPRSTVQRIVGALQAERLLIANISGGGVRLGPELGALAEAAQFNTAEQCRPLLVELTQSTSETSDLSVLRGDKMIFLDQVPGTHRLRTVSSIGEVFPLTTTANGGLASPPCHVKPPCPSPKPKLQQQALLSIQSSSGRCWTLLLKLDLPMTTMITLMAFRPLVLRLRTWLEKSTPSLCPFPRHVSCAKKQKLRPPCKKS